MRTIPSARTSGTPLTRRRPPPGVDREGWCPVAVPHPVRAPRVFMFRGSGPDLLCHWSVAHPTSSFRASTAETPPVPGTWGESVDVARGVRGTKPTYSHDQPGGSRTFSSEGHWGRGFWAGPSRGSSVGHVSDPESCGTTGPTCGARGGQWGCTSLPWCTTPRTAVGVGM